MKKLILLAAITGCTCQAEKVSFETLEDARRQARENAEFVARADRSASPEYSACSLGTAGDSTQKPECPQGDGWASLALRCGGTDTQIKCSTVSAAIGCIPADQFKTKPFAAEEGRCNPDIPHPLPKMAK